MLCWCCLRSWEMYCATARSWRRHDLLYIVGNCGNKLWPLMIKGILSRCSLGLFVPASCFSRTSKNPRAVSGDRRHLTISRCRSTLATKSPFPENASEHCQLEEGAPQWHGLWSETMHLAIGPSLWAHTFHTSQYSQSSCKQQPSLFAPSVA